MWETCVSATIAEHERFVSKRVGRIGAFPDWYRVFCLVGEHLGNHNVWGQMRGGGCGEK